jgi:tRNA(adenine34) deaminase
MWMRAALDQARRAGAMGEVPIGAVLVANGILVATGHNERESQPCPTAHAEILAIQRAASKLQRWRLHDCTLYVTLEPCPMCAGAIVQARIPRVVFAIRDPKAGAGGSLYNILRDERLNHRVEITEGVEAEDCLHVLKEFFRQKRAGTGKPKPEPPQR